MSESVEPTQVGPYKVGPHSQVGLRPAPASSSPGTTRIESGSVLFGEYEIVGHIDSGGMGDVYRAHHRSLQESRAIKVMRPELMSDATAVSLFLREARALLDVRHDAVLRCHDLLRDESGRMYLITELLEGPTLSDVLAKRVLEPTEVRALLDRLAAGLAASHARGVVHRDVSPDNIVLEGGRVECATLIDFGVARLMDGATTSYGFKGKLAYASPEQLGLYGGGVDGRSDLYSLGLVLLQAATGRIVSNASTLVDAVELRRRVPRIPGSLPRALRSDLRRLLAPNPEKRARSAERILARQRARDQGYDRLTRAASVACVLLGLAIVTVLVSRYGSVWRDPNPAVDTSFDTSLPSIDVDAWTNPNPDDPGGRDTDLRAGPEFSDAAPVGPEPLDPEPLEPGTGSGTDAASVVGEEREEVEEICTPDRARTRAALELASGRACRALQTLDLCCPDSVRACADMRREFRSRCNRE